MPNLTYSLISLTSPDMLLYPDADCAVYSAHFQESERLVWEGHGLLSWMLDADSKPGTILGKVRGDHIEVTLQLHPVSLWPYPVQYKRLTFSR